MGWLWQRIIDEVDFGRRVEKEIRDSKIIIEIKREIDIPILTDPSNEIKKQLGMVLRDYGFQDDGSVNDVLRRAIAEAVQKDVTALQQKIHEKIHEKFRRAKDEATEYWKNQLEEIESNLQAKMSEALPAAVASLLEARKREIEELNNVIDAQKKQIENLRVEINDQKQKIAGLDTALRSCVQTMESLQSNITPKESENLALRQKLDAVEERLAKLEQQNTVQALSDLKRQMEKLTSAWAARDTAPIPTPEPVQPVPPVPPSPWIADFLLTVPETRQAFFHGNGSAVREKLVQSIQGMDELAAHVGQSRIAEPARSSFLKNLRWCKEELAKLYDKFDFAGCDEDELSESITEKFFKIISEKLLDNIMVAIYRGGRDAVGYRAFLQSMNRYLSKHGIYTMNIKPGSPAEGEMFANIEPPLFKSTANAAEDGKIAEVELLPYVMSYEDDDGNIETVHKRGRIICLKYGV